MHHGPHAVPQGGKGLLIHGLAGERGMAVLCVFNQAVKQVHGLASGCLEHAVHGRHRPLAVQQAVEALLALFLCHALQKCRAVQKDGGRVDHGPLIGGQRQTRRHIGGQGAQIIAALAEIIIGRIFQAQPQVQQRAHAGHHVVAVEDVIERIGGRVLHQSSRGHSGRSEAIARHILRKHAPVGHQPVAEHLHDRRTLAVTGHPQAEAAAQALHLGKHLAQGELFQAQRLCRGGKDDAFRALLKIGAQLIKPLVEPFLRGEAEVGNPVVKALAGAHKANGQQELSPGQGMHHAHRLDGIAALPLAQGAHHLRHGVALAQGGLGAAHLEGIDQRAHALAVRAAPAGQAALQVIVDLDGKIVPPRLRPRFQIQRVSHAGQLQRQLGRLARKRRAQAVERIAHEGLDKAAEVTQVPAGDGPQAGGTRGCVRLVRRIGHSGLHLWRKGKPGGEIQGKVHRFASGKKGAGSVRRRRGHRK